MPGLPRHGLDLWGVQLRRGVDDTVFDYYCPNWNSNPNASYYGARRGGCLLRLVDLGTMPQGSPGTWIYQDEYLQWYCSSSGPGGGLFGF